MLSRETAAVLVAFVGLSTGASAVQAQNGPTDWSGFYSGASIGGGAGTNRLSPRMSPVQQNTVSVTSPGTLSCTMRSNLPTYRITQEQLSALQQNIVLPSIIDLLGLVPTASNVGTSYARPDGSLINLVGPNNNCFVPLGIVQFANQNVIRLLDNGPSGTAVETPGTTTTTTTTALVGPFANARGVDAATLAALAAFPGQRQDIHTSGIVGGGQVGYNYQVGGILLGVEADVSGSGMEGSYRVGGFTARSGIDWYGTVRGRVGYAWDSLLVYGTGGFAYGDVSLSYILTDVAVRDTKMQTGWVAGLGFEYALTPLKAEYKHIDLGAGTFLRKVGYDARVMAAADTGVIGLNYRW